MSNKNATKYKVGDRVIVQLWKGYEAGVIVDLGPSATGDTLYWVEIPQGENAGTVTTATDRTMVGTW